jgi:hypothetical protein
MKDITFKNLTDEQINAIKVLLGDACEIEEQKEEEVPFFPAVGDDYYFLYSNGDIGDTQYTGTTSDITREFMGNCFKTKEEAKFEVERLKVIHEIKKFAEPEDYAWDGENTHYHIYYNFCCNAIRTGYTYSYKKDTVFFKSKEDINACIEAVGEDRIIKYYLGVKEEEVNNFIKKTRN